MLSNLNGDLFEKMLVEPAKKQGVDRLLIVSGFATASMADRHMETMSRLNLKIGIELIVGMANRNGIEKAQHHALQELAQRQPYDGMDFSCRYVVRGNPVHAKTYCWLQGGNVAGGFVGSANYTRTAFGRGQIETMHPVEGEQVEKFYKKILGNTANCLDSDIENKVILKKTRQISDGGETKTLSLLNKSTGETPSRSGINWGQREGRNKDQAYINIPADTGQSGFFPDRAEPFTVLTDDDYSFIMVRAQDGGKGLHTTQSNAILGKYLRDRMGIPPGAYVTRKDLVKYGRTDITFTKIDDETYLLDFLPNMGPGEDMERQQE